MSLLVFSCSICSEASTEICIHCTKDACPNHRCAKCLRCSDCCRCEVPLDVAEGYRWDAVEEEDGQDEA